MMRLVLILCCAALFTTSIYGQTLQTDLEKSFRQFTVVSIDNAVTHRKAANGSPLEIQVNGLNYRFALKPNDVRSAEYKAEYTDKDGRHSLPRGEIYTYQGTIIGEPNSLVALTIDGAKVEGYFATQSEGYFIESAKKYSSRADDDEKVVYRVKDKVQSNDDICGLDEAVAAGMKLADKGAADWSKAGTSAIRRILEVATEADMGFVLNPSTGNGDPAQANRHILSVMNQVDAVFRRDLNLRVVVTFQHAWTSGAVDPYAGLNRSNLLNAFADYWNVKFPTTNPNYQRDVGHLFTLHGGVSGQAIASRICRGTAASYSFTSENTTNKWIATAHELGHNLGADHACPDTIMQATLNSYATEFCQFSKDQISSHINTYGDRCLEADTTGQPAPSFDFDGDGRADLAVFRPSNGFWYVAKSSGGFSYTKWGQQRDKLAPADYDGDGRTDYAVYRALANMIIFPIPADDVFYILRSSDNGILSRSFQGNIDGFPTSDLPVPADYDGDGRTDLAIYSETDENGTPIVFDVLESSTGARIRTQWGLNTDRKVPADYDGDGRADYAVYRNGTWFIMQSATGTIRTERFGLENDLAVPSDYDGDGKADIAVWRPSNGYWYRLNSRDNSFAAVQFGLTDDQPTPADYDGDGKTDIAVWRASTGVWYILRSRDGFAAQQFGSSGDIPIPSVYVRY